MVQWDKDSCGDAGFLKIDLLGLGMLSAVERCVDEIARVRGERIDLSRIPYDDQEVYSQIQDAETMGVFQIESRAQMQSLVRTRPESLDDLTVQVALVRPGPIQGGAVHPYIERRKRLREDPSYEVPYLHPSLEPVLRDTLGAIVFQDQVLEVAMAFAGFRAGEAEGLRRAMSRRRSEAAIRAYEEKFVTGGDGERRHARGRPSGSGRRSWASRASASRRRTRRRSGCSPTSPPGCGCTTGPSSCAALLNEQPMGFYPPDTLVHEAQRRGMAVLPAVRRCAARRSAGVEDGESPSGIGLGYVNGVREHEVRAHGRGARAGGRVALARGPGGALGRVRRDARPARLGGGVRRAARRPAESRRRRALWELGVAVPGYVGAGGHPAGPAAGAARRRRSCGAVRLGADARRLRLHRGHAARAPAGADAPRPARRPAHQRGARAPSARRRVRVAGLVVARQRPATAKGITFMLLEDEHGTVNLIVPPPVHERCRLAVRAEPLVLADGRLERREGMINVVVDRIERLERPDLPRAEVRHIEPRRTWSTNQEEADLRAVVARRRTASGGGASGRCTAPEQPDQAASEAAGTSRHAADGRAASSWAPPAGPIPASSKEWYPPGLPASERLPWYAQRFEGVELNSSFYAIPDRNTVRAGRRSPRTDFVFDVKVHRALSRHAAQLDSLPPDLRDGAKTNERGRVMLTAELEDDAGRAAGGGDRAARRGRQARRVPAAAHAGVLARDARARRARRPRSSAAPRPVAIELRHRGWVAEERRR